MIKNERMVFIYIIEKKRVIIIKIIVKEFKIQIIEKKITNFIKIKNKKDRKKRKKINEVIIVKIKYKKN